MLEPPGDALHDHAGNEASQQEEIISRNQDCLLGTQCKPCAANTFRAAATNSERVRARLRDILPSVLPSAVSELLFMVE